MIKCILIDDEPLASALLGEYLEEHEDVEIVGVFENGFEGYKGISQLQPDLVFLDVQMPKLNGFELLDLLDQPPGIIFTTAFDQFALKAFEVHAVDYLLKPFSEARLAEALDRYRAREGQGKQRAFNELNATLNTRLSIKDEGKIRLLEFEDILRLEADGDYSHLYTRQGKITLKKSLSSLEDRLPADQFVRIHRSHLMRLEELDRIDPYGKNDHTARLKSGEILPVSRSGYRRLRDLLQL